MATPRAGSAAAGKTVSHPGLDATITHSAKAMNQRPPLVNTELAFDSLTHNPRSRRVKLTLTHRF